MTIAARHAVHAAHRPPRADRQESQVWSSRYVRGPRHTGERRAGQALRRPLQWRGQRNLAHGT